MAKRILLIVGGGIAAYKACEVVRLLRGAGHSVRCVLTEGGAHFVTAMTLAALSEQPVHTSLWDLKDEAEMGHIRLSREADLVVICPATADLLARMAAGFADDLATTLLLATDKPVLAIPAMNVRMWRHAATQRNVAQLRADAVTVMTPAEGAMACGEWGPGRLPEPTAILSTIKAMLAPATDLEGLSALVTAGPTHEPIDPVRYIANRSSGKQGFAIAAALAHRGARVRLVAGPVALETPAGVERVDVTTACEMQAAVAAALPMDVAILAAAVADWRIAPAARKLKRETGSPPALSFTENPDILATLGHSPDRPHLLIGFAAETDDVIANAVAKRGRKGCDWIVANDVSREVFGSSHNAVYLVMAHGVEEWPRAPKAIIAERLVDRIVKELRGSA